MKESLIEVLSVKQIWVIGLILLFLVACGGEKEDKIGEKNTINTIKTYEEEVYTLFKKENKTHSEKIELLSYLKDVNWGRYEQTNGSSGDEILMWLSTLELEDPVVMELIMHISTSLNGFDSETYNQLIKKMYFKNKVVFFETFKKEPGLVNPIGLYLRNGLSIKTKEEIRTFESEIEVLIERGLISRPAIKHANEIKDIIIGSELSQ